MIIYKITNKITNKVYIGQTRMALSRRWNQHKTAKRKSPLYSSMFKYGIQNFTIKQIDKAENAEDLNKLEIFYIKQHNCIYPNGYNLSLGGEVGFTGCIPWNKDKNTGLVPKTAFKKGQKAWNEMMQTPIAVRAKQSIAKLGKHISPNTEFKQGQPSAFKGKKHNAEALAKISENGNRRSVICVETGQVYESIKSASESTNIAKSHLRRMCISETKHKKTGLTFKFVSKKG